MDRLDHIKFKTGLSWKDTTKRMGRQVAAWGAGRVSEHHYRTKGSKLRILRSPTNQFFKKERELKGYIHTKICFSLFIIAKRWKQLNYPKTG